ncbi:hypothetical protein [Microbacterium sp. Kw_RZR3]|jgi:hypothetical protein|uniref:hypothetical protein n=1 Tax=unclassified Microbacterium TaxID=2609290 RepID=UPI0023D9AE5D|nr:hypothetical protein [Microbacterium sp. Kw_RZR3]MDF2047961.1 hypothetical protein [Microbacterium sp. Kw_RZR3]MDF2917184.1 hypothetical protein [Microbacterium sp.]
MTATTTLERARSAVSRRALAAALAFVAVFGIAVGAAAPAHAGIGMWYVSSSWVQSYAALTSTGGDGYFQAKAVLGGNVKWGKYSPNNTQAQADGFSFSHSAFLFQNGRVWKSG